MSDGTRFVVYLLGTWALACLLIVAAIALVYFVLGWGVFSGTGRTG